MRMSVAVFALSFAVTASAEPLSQTDRDRVLSELQVSRQQFVNAVSGLTPAQWIFKAGPDRWSVAEIAEHIIAGEGFMRAMVVNQLMATPADPAKVAGRRPLVSRMDEGFLSQLRDRSQKATAPGEIVPRGIYKTPAEALTAFQAARDKTVEYVRTATGDLRGHFLTPFPGFEMDGVQGLLMIAGHNERHVLQMNEVKQTPDYPGRTDDRLIKPALSPGIRQK